MTRNFIKALVPDYIRLGVSIISRDPNYIVTDVLSEANPFKKKVKNFEMFYEKYKDKNKPIDFTDFIRLIGINKVDFVKDWISLTPKVFEILD